MVREPHMRAQQMDEIYGVQDAICYGKGGILLDSISSYRAGWIKNHEKILQVKIGARTWWAEIEQERGSEKGEMSAEVFVTEFRNKRYRADFVPALADFPSMISTLHNPRFAH